MNILSFRMGYPNTPSVFQDFMHEVLWEFLHHFVLVYTDDILIYSRSEAKHHQHVVEVLQKLREYQLYLKADKCMFHQTSVQFLGYNISKKGNQMDEGKVDAIHNWPTPATIKELQRFLGSKFYRKFIQNYSSITSSLTNLLKNKPKTLSLFLSTREALQHLRSIHQCTITHSSRSQKTIHCGVRPYYLSSREHHQDSIYAHSFHVSSTRRNRIMTSATMNFWLSSWRWKNGDTGWKEHNIIF